MLYIIRYKDNNICQLTVQNMTKSIKSVGRN